MSSHISQLWWIKPCMTHKNEDKIQIFFFPLLPLCMNFDTTGYTKRSWWTLWPASGVLWSLLVLYQLMALTTNFLLIQPSCSKPKECEMRHLCQRTKRQHLFFLIFFLLLHTSRLPMPSICGTLGKLKFLVRCWNVFRNHDIEPP